MIKPILQVEKERLEGLQEKIVKEKNVGFRTKLTKSLFSA